MKIIIEVFDSLPCSTELFEIDGLKADQDWFVDNYDNGQGDEIEYGCNNRVTDLLSITEVRNKLPKKFQFLTDKEIEKIQNELSEKLCSGGCGWCV